MEKNNLNTVYLNSLLENDNWKKHNYRCVLHEELETESSETILEPFRSPQSKSAEPYKHS